MISVQFNFRPTTLGRRREEERAHRSHAIMALIPGKATISPLESPKVEEVDEDRREVRICMAVGIAGWVGDGKREMRW